MDARARVNVMPLGSGALAGSTILLDRQLVARELDFPVITQNSMDAVRRLCRRDLVLDCPVRCASVPPQ